MADVSRWVSEGNKVMNGLLIFNIIVAFGLVLLGIFKPFPYNSNQAYRILLVAGLIGIASIFIQFYLRE